MPDLGVIERVYDLRTIWPHEAYDFTKWLAQDENLSVLSNAIGIDITLEETESAVGSFSVDLFATEEGTGRRIIIENQLEDTNHDHLGKIITYASGKNAEVVIWIVRHARDEHKQAIEWLNQRTDDNIGFFLLEIELWRIDNSLPAPKFNIVERPNDWAKTMKATEGISDTRKLQLRYWQAFAEYAFARTDFQRAFTKRKPLPQQWYSLSIGNSQYSIDLLINTQKKRITVGIYARDKNDIYQRFNADKERIETELGTPLEWRTGKKGCRAYVSCSADIEQDESAWPAQFSWLCSMALKLRDIAKKHSL